MESRGRGLRRGKRGANEEEETPKKVSTAWADFMAEEHTEEGNDSTNEKSNKEDTNNQEQERQYKLPIVPHWTTEKKSKAKKAKTDSPLGLLVQSGTLDSSCVGRAKSQLNQTYDLVIPTILLPKFKVTKVISSCNAVHALCITSDGQLFGWGRNEANQLGSNLPKMVGKPTDMEFSGPAVEAAVGKSHSVVIDNKNQVFAVGSNKVGQCAVKSSADTVNNFKKCVISAKVVQVSCGEATTLALDEDGFMYTAGSSEYGQLGNGETGEHFVSANKLAFANSNIFVKQVTFVRGHGEKLYGKDAATKTVEITEDIRIGYIACGKNHCIAIEASGNQPSRVFSWGCGNYGCLGHGQQKDEYRPRLISSLSQGHVWKTNPPVSASCGASCTLILTKEGHLYYFGKHRSVGEAVMRPQVLAELANNGHVVTNASAGNQTVVCSTKNGVTVAWGQGPHGELGLEGKKSSAKPQFVSKLDKCRIQSLACGYGTTYWVVKEEDSDDKAALKELDVVSDDTYEELQKLCDSNS